MKSNKEVYNILNGLGLEDEEILSVEKRNKFFKLAIAEDVTDVVNLLSNKYKLNNEAIAQFILNNPLILNENASSMEAYTWKTKF